MTRRGNIRLFSVDLDGTLLGRPEASWRFIEAWRTLDPRRRPLLVYNTGRSVQDTQGLVVSERLLEPDFIIGGVGTEFHDGLYNRSTEFYTRFGPGWNRAAVDTIVGAWVGVKRQPEDRLHGFKSSWIWPRAGSEQLDELRGQLASAGLDVAVVYSCQHFLDVLPACAGKGPALRWLCDRLGIALEEVLVAGDTANDGSMFLLPGVRGIVVENALPELRDMIAACSVFAASLPMADGVLEGLAHFEVPVTLAADPSRLTDLSASPAWQRAIAS